MSRVTRLVLRAYPRSIREEFGEEIARGLDARLHAHRARLGVLGAATALAAGLLDAMQSHVHWRRERTGSRRRFGAFVADLHYAARTWRRAPLFYGGLILTLGLGIAANALVFALIDAVAWRPLPYADQDRVVMFWRGHPERPTNRGTATAGLLAHWKREAAGIADVAGVKEYGSLEADMDLAAASGTERLAGAFATSNFFDVLGARAAAGRLFSAADDAVGDDDVVVLSHRVWRRSFGADANLIGKTITLTNGVAATRRPRTYRVIGILPADFHFNYEARIEVWVMRPWAAIAAESQNNISYKVIGRLAPGVALDAAQARLSRADNERTRVYLERVADWVRTDTAQTLALLGGVAAALLLITCGTVASALLIRITERRRELSLRTALGATRGRVLAQLMSEGLALAAAGTACGLLLTATTLPVLRALVPLDLPRGDELTLDRSLLVFMIAIFGAVTLLASAAPAWRGARGDVAATLKANAGAVSADARTARWRWLLVALQSGLASALLLVATLLIVSVWQLGRVDPGFSADDVITVEMRLLDERARNMETLRRLQEDLLLRVGAVPGVARVGMTSAVPFRGVDWYWNVDLPRGFEQGRGTGNGRQVDPAFFSIMRIALKRGRVIEAHDVAGAPDVAVVSESFARGAFGDADPIGQIIVQERPLTIVGVVADLRYQRFDADPAPAIYVSRAQFPVSLICLLIKPATPDADLGAAIRAAIHGVDPTVPAMKLASIRDVLDESTAGRRFYTSATTTFAMLALLLTLAGILVIVGRVVVERQKELAIRAALGATASRLRRLVIGQGLVPVLAGVGVGLAAAFIAAPALQPFLFGVTPRDARLYAGVAAVIVAAGTLAAVWPARRLTSAAPVHMLRAD